MDITRNDYSDVRSNATDDQKFKKAYQVVDRPQATGRDIHEDYLRSPPRNQPPEYGDTSVSRHPGIKEGAREPVDPKRDGVLGDEAASKVTKQSELEAVTTQNSVHP
ncbi:hypothetical protein WOLCODRAFT_149987 [Wolfiporia cocos MD-104 SS10]|uniref:Uncharacterized protein n=1 Tax=Wolfiporia cocos (strain MD-104) TaxID=742152 RepID=A0A2H3JCL1_WOLCO|nr:hypothetical protein WOLCODRAFT_149987 [Wolfiporia cocos MD-104 SS10]